MFIAEDIADNRIYDKAELIVTKFRNIKQVVDLLRDLARRVLCAWYVDDFGQLFQEVDEVFEKRNSHCHNVFNILDEDTYQMSSATAHYEVMMGNPASRKKGPSKVHQQHSLKDLREVAQGTSDCISQLEYLMGTPSRGPILRSAFFKLPLKERETIVERENDPGKIASQVKQK